MNKKTMLQAARLLGAQGGKAAAENMTATQRKVRAKKAAAASAKVRTAQAKVSHPVTLYGEKIKAMIHAFSRSRVGITTHDQRGLGTGTLILADDGRPSILTAAHVIEGVSESDMRFFMPTPGGEIGSSPVPLHQIRSNQLIHPLQLKFAEIHVDAKLDLALLTLSPDVELSEHWHFRNLAGDHPPLRPGHTLLMTGYPGARAYTLPDGSRLASPNVDYPTILPPTTLQHRDFDPTKHLLVDFPSAGDFDPHGYSGGPLWYNQPPAESALWVPAPGLAGIVILYHRNRKVLIVVKRRIILKFLAAAARWKKAAVASPKRQTAKAKRKTR